MPWGGLSLNKRTKLGLAIGGVAAAIVALVVTGLSSATTYYYTVDEFRALGAQEVGQYVQVNGVPSRDYRWDAATATLTFTLEGAKSPPVPVVYRGAVPDGFAGAPSVVVGGRLGADGVFRATTLLVKCPSKYVAQPSGGGAQPARAPAGGGSGG
jgi:cytochrome c-type biogenesis protein CcmE